MKMLRLTLAVLLLPISCIGLVLVVCGWIVLTTPDVRELRGCITTSMYHVSLCPKGPNYVKLSQISDIAVDAVIASEDTTFYQHNGFDWYEIKSSLTKNMKQKAFARGGSTITQQLAKNVYLTGEKSLLRKLREAFLTYALEKNFSKDEILEKYLNVVELGPNIYGIEPAAEYYFKKTPDKLNLLEAAFLAFLLPNPKGYHKSFKDRKLTPFARTRILDISARLMKFSKTSSASYAQARSVVDQFPWAGLSLNDSSEQTAHRDPRDWTENPITTPAEDDAKEPANAEPSNEEKEDLEDSAAAAETGDSDADDDGMVEEEPVAIQHPRQPASPPAKDVTHAFDGE